MHFTFSEYLITPQLPNEMTLCTGVYGDRHFESLYMILSPHRRPLILKSLAAPEDYLCHFHCYFSYKVASAAVFNLKQARGTVPNGQTDRQECTYESHAFLALQPI